MIVRMRVLFSTTAGSGHFGPMVPFAQACRDAGHEVKVAAPASFAEAVAAAGLDHAPFADVPPEVMGPIYGRLPELSREEANRVVMVEIFGRLDAQAALPGVTATIADWRPAVVVREFCEFGSLVAAQKAGVPQVEVAIGFAVGFPPVLREVAGPLAELEAMAGLPDGTATRALASGPVFSCIPAEIDGGDETGGARIRRFREASLTTEPGSPLPAWGDPGHPLVYVTFGSVTGGLPPFAGMYRSVLDALAGEPLRVLMTTGRAVDTGSLGPLPANARVEQWLPQGDVVPHTDVLVGHGGFGTTMAALAGGVPQVVIPLFASDQFVNAERVAAVGAGVCLEGGPGAVPALAPALADVLGDPAYQKTAQGVAAAMAALPDIASSVPLLEDLAQRRTR
jgi:UDP:flavonoid glycosyltransferase YjiC (YdhE family)